MFCNSYTSHVNKTEGSKNYDEKQEHKANNIKTLILSPSRPFHVKTDTHFIVQRASLVEVTYKCCHEVDILGNIKTVSYFRETKKEQFP